MPSKGNFTWHPPFYGCFSLTFPDLINFIVFRYACIQFILAIQVIQWYTWILETRFNRFL